ncbi:right-handed parallel beta-helix repeat-containing protein [Niastella sp. OAS944]|uniref:right-handed parallel beta-helix repeat-containing protein n=1 Tax=Niastella sp. OAS944 TaxID=2664089 RepID=UPI003496BAD0|nr:gliding motility-associated-like protein [Chitinophagaceae bacterium OAS944]
MRKILRGHLFNKNILFTLCLGLCFLGEAHAQVSGTFTINSTLPASGSNFQTFSAAVAFVSSGGINGPVTFNVTGGSTYNEQVIINAISGTSATNTITFNCNGVTLSFLSTDYNQRAGVKLNGADYITFDNLNITPEADDFGEYGYGFHLINDADHNTIKNCHITNVVDWSNTDNHEGIVINGNDGASWDFGESFCDDNLIQNNTITGGTVGITLNSLPSSWLSAPGNFMSGNKIVGNTFSNFIYYAIQMYYTSGTVIDGNDITGGPDATSTLYGMWFDTYNYGFSIVKNKIHGFHLTAGSDVYGIWVGSMSAPGQTCLIANNLMYDFRTNGKIFGIYAGKNSSLPYATSYLNVYNNTISIDDQVTLGSEAYGMNFEQTTYVQVMNNVITVTRRSFDFNYGLRFAFTPNNFASQRNVIYVPDGPAGIDAVGRVISNDYVTMASWKAGTGYDYYSTDVNPGYTSLATFNFRPTTQSIDNMAANLNVLTDIDGVARNTANPDAGCYEFISTACASSITGGTINVLPDSVLCSGPQISLGLIGNSAGGGQTYTWQSSTSPTSGFTDMASPLGFPYLETTPTSTRYYRVALTCGGNTAYSKIQRIVVNTTLNAGTYTINSTQPTGGVNFQSFSDVAKALQCGFNGSLVFNVASGSGPYNEQFLLTDIPSSATNTVTFNCNGATITYAPTAIENSAVVKLKNSDYITIDSLNVEVQGSSTYGVGIQLLEDADNNTIKRCKINLSTTTTEPFYAGISITSKDDDPKDASYPTYCDNNLFANNTITGGTYGIALASVSVTVNSSFCVGNIVRNNKILDNYLCGIYMQGLGNTLIDSNEISQPTRTVLPLEYRGMYLFEYNYGVTITRNRIHHLGDKVPSTITEYLGIKCENVNLAHIANEPVVISNNLVYTFRGRGQQYGFNNVSSRYILYYHNTISLDDSTSVNPGVVRCFGSFGAIADKVEVKDNIFFIRRAGTNDKFGIYIDLADNSLVANNNNYFISSTGSNVYMGFLNKVNYATLANWQAATGKDAASVSIHPVFEDMAKGDYTPTKILLENRGANVGIANDFLNNSRNSTTPDIGAIEYTICRQLANPALTLAEASVNTIKYSWTSVKGTSGYRVSRDGINWSIPSSGDFGTTHTIVGLNPTDSVKLIVKALGSRADCPEYVSQWVGAQAQSDKVFIPNMFSPNNNQVDDYFKVYSTVMKTMHLMVFNQWGVKVFETNDPQGQWDGTYKGKPQPIGVYVYVVTGALFDGTKVNQKGTFNLIR